MTTLKCDANGCDYEEKAEITADLIGKPCPECGANLLTKQDYEDAMKMHASIKILEYLGLAKLVSEKTDDTFSFNPHAGKLIVTPPISLARKDGKENGQ